MDSTLAMGMVSPSSLTAEPSCPEMAPDHRAAPDLNAFSFSRMALRAASGTGGPKGASFTRPSFRLPRKCPVFQAPSRVDATIRSMRGPQFQDAPVCQPLGANLEASAW